jgi:hypothetical protein
MGKKDKNKMDKDKDKMDKRTGIRWVKRTRIRWIKGQE